MNKLLLAGAVSAALFAGQAVAVPLHANGTVDFSNTTGIYAPGVVVNEVWVSGSSAATPFLEKAVINDSVGTVYKYVDAAKSAITYVSDSSIAPGTINVVHKRDGGGSITGVKAAQGTFPKFNDSTSLDTATLGALAGSLQAVTAPGLTQSIHATNLNFSDVDAAQFESPLNGGVAGAGSVPSTAVATQTFGIAANLKLRNALQKAAIDAGTLPATCTVGNETEACIPNLTSADISSLFGANRVTDWGNLRYGGAAGKNLFTAQLAADRPANRDIHICSRTAGSGTLATVNIKFENAPCFAGAEAIQAASALTVTPETGANGSLKAYHSLAGSGDVEDCLEGLNTGAAQGNFTPYPGSTASFRWAIGILGTERNPANAKAFRFLRIDGASPSLANVAQGKYKFWGELATVGAVSADALTQDLLANVKNANQISTVNVNNPNFGITGYMGVANNAAFPATFNTAINGLISAAFDPARPVNPFTHEVATGGALNHCRLPNVPGGAKALPALY